MSVTTIKNKLQQAQQIKAQIRTVAATKDIDFPEDAPFAQYPAYIATIKGHLEEKAFSHLVHVLTSFRKRFSPLPYTLIIHLFRVLVNRKSKNKS